MAGGITWHYVLKFIITGTQRYLIITHGLSSPATGDAAVGKSSLLIRLTDQRFLANPDPTVRDNSLSADAVPGLTKWDHPPPLARSRIWLETDRNT
jgi:hypothetical protein